MIFQTLLAIRISSAEAVRLVSKPSGPQRMRTLFPAAARVWRWADPAKTRKSLALRRKGVEESANECGGKTVLPEARSVQKAISYQCYVQDSGNSVRCLIAQ